LVGSMILAGVLLKLGGFGLYKSFIFVFKDFFDCKFYIISIGMIGSLIISLFCIRQTDIKSLIAYSSVAHMGSVLASLCSIRWVGLLGSYFIILAHGLCSSALFYVLNVAYIYLNSRRILILKGGIFIFPILTYWWFIFCVFNISCPPSFNFLSELIIFFCCLWFWWLYSLFDWCFNFYRRII